jgi:hypothetical protein
MKTGKIGMKRCLLFACIMFASCGTVRDRDEPQVGARPQDSYRTRYTLKEEVPLFPDRQEPSLDFVIDLIDAVDGAERRLLRQTLYGGLSCEEYADKVFEKVKSGYAELRAGAEADAEAAGGKPGASYNWSYYEEFEAAAYPGLLVVSRRLYVYSGGAHGNSERTYFVLDTALSKRLRLDDLLAEGARPLLQQRIDAALRARYGDGTDAPLSSIGFFADSAGLSENFFVTDAGLGFCWNPYEIAPYAMGAVEAVLPYAEVESLLNDRGRRLLRSAASASPSQ